MAYSEINQSEINIGSVADQALLQKIKDNFDSLKTDVIIHASTLQTHASTISSHASSLVTQASNITANANKVAKQVPIGTVRSSTLTLAQFQAEVDGTWQLMNGDSCVGTAYATLTGNATVPDAATNGTFLRQITTGRGLGSFENDAMQGHQHGWDGAVFSNHNDYTGTNYIRSASGGAVSPTNTPHVGNAVSNGTHGTPRTASETRPKNVGVNFFIKVGY